MTLSAATFFFYDGSKMSINTASPVQLQLYHWLWKRLFLVKPPKT